MGQLIKGLFKFQFHTSLLRTNEMDQGKTRIVASHMSQKYIIRFFFFWKENTYIIHFLEIK
jgi:hypothetical protein